MSFKSGFISIIGCPNVGKSTLLNTILGEKIVIVSNKPQTTRNKVLGIKHLSGGQIIFIDTPGIHKSKGHLNEYMIKEALRTLKEVDILLYLVEADKTIRERDLFIIDKLKKVPTPVVLSINKIDRYNRDALLPLIANYAKIFNFKEIVPISALKNNGINSLLKTLLSILPEGPKYFPDDALTDIPERFIVAEIIREKIFESVRKEVPYSVASVVDMFKEEPAKNIISIMATIYVERSSQKGIIIGGGGKKLKEIGTRARKDIERLLGTKVFLKLFVSVKKDWTKNLKKLKDFGYH
jgi:GTP-binding protein Era